MTTVVKFDLASYSVSADTEALISKELKPFTESLDMWRKQAESITVKDASDKDGMKFARELRLTIRPKRTAVEEVRKRLKADSLAFGRAVDGVAKDIMGAMQEIEADLQQKEDFAKIEEEKREKALETSRLAVLAEYGEYSFLTDLGKWTQDRFEAYLVDQKAILEVRLAREAQEEAERIAKENEAETLRAEMDRIKKEADARQADLEAELQKQKAETDRLALEQSKAKARERLRIQEEEKQKSLAESIAKAAERRAAAAPDKDKLMAVRKAFEDVVLPEVKSDGAKSVMNNISVLKQKLLTYIDQKVAEL